MIKKYVLLLVIFFFGTKSGLRAQQITQTFVQQTHYLLYLPEHYQEDSLTRWPLVLFLHGSGEVGDSIDWVTRNGPPKLAKAGRKFPFILVSPQAQDYEWFPHDLEKLLADIKKNYRVDNARVYLTGLSMGGFGTWSMAEEYPDEFAAIIPLSGGGDTSKAWKMRYLPAWCFHGLKDPVVAPSGSINMIKALRQFELGAKLTVYPDGGHDSWTATYNNDSVYQWMLAQKRSPRKRVSLSVSLLRDYTGAYISKGGDTVYLSIKDSAILATRNGYQTMLTPAKKDLFFIDENSSVDVRFERDAAGKVSSVEVWANEKEFFKKSKK